jgi:hypothetical protein
MISLSTQRVRAPANGRNIVATRTPSATPETASNVADRNLTANQQGIARVAMNQATRIPSR